MISWHIELEARVVELSRVDIPEIREKIDPVKNLVNPLLSNLEDEVDELKIVFVIDEDGYLSISLRGSSLIVHSARDQIGSNRRLGVRII